MRPNRLRKQPEGTSEAGPLEGPMTAPEGTKSVCSVEGCGGTVVAWGLCSRCYQRQRYRNDPKHREYRKEYMRRHNRKPEVRRNERERSRRRRATPEYKERFNAYRRNRYANDPEYRRSVTEARRLRKPWDETVTPETVAEMLENQGGRCPLCGHDIQDGYEMDHIQPQSKGGASTITNLQLLCRACNRKKGNKTPHRPRTSPPEPGPPPGPKSLTARTLLYPAFADFRTYSLYTSAPARSSFCACIAASRRYWD